MNESWAAFHFLRPQWWLLLVIPIIYTPFSIRSNVHDAWKRYIDTKLLDHLMMERRRSWRLRPIHMFCLLIFLGVIAIAGPIWKRERGAVCGG
jgi:Ca-activated chloride channel family protein